MRDIFIVMLFVFSLNWIIRSIVDEGKPLTAEEEWEKEHRSLFWKSIFLSLNALPYALMGACLYTFL